MAEAKRRQFKKKVVISTNIISEKLYYNASDNEEVTGLLAEQILTRCKTLRNEQDEEIESSKLRNLTVKEREEKKKKTMQKSFSKGHFLVLVGKRIPCAENCSEDIEVPGF